MAKSKKGVAPIFWIAGTLFVILCMGAIMWLTPASQQSIVQTQAVAVHEDSCPMGKVCLSEGEYERLREPKTIIVQQQPALERAVNRDRRVLDDPLYPPLNRIDRATHDAVNVQVQNRNMYVPTRDIGDSYRLVGYLVNNEEEPDKGGNSWKLFARQKDRHTSDFYMVPANKNYDIKIPIKDEMVQGARLRDLYTIPNQITFNSPLLNKTPYEFIENPKTDYSSSEYS